MATIHRLDPQYVQSAIDEIAQVLDHAIASCYELQVTMNCKLL